MEQQEQLDPWIVRADELKQNMEVLLEEQLQQYEVMNAKLEKWKEDPSQPWLTLADYEPWQNALKKLEAAQREFDAHISTRIKK